MAAIVTSVEKTTLVLNGTAINDYASGDIITLTPVNPVSSHVNGSNGSVNINERSDRDVYDLTIRVLRMTDSDSFLNNVMRTSPITVLNGSLKENFTKDNVDNIESWILENGSIITQPTITINNEDGNGLVEYVVRFRKATRNI